MVTVMVYSLLQEVGKNTSFCLREYSKYHYAFILILYYFRCFIWNSFVYDQFSTCCTVIRAVTVSMNH